MVEGAQRNQVLVARTADAAHRRRARLGVLAAALTEEAQLDAAAALRQLGLVDGAVAGLVDHLPMESEARTTAAAITAMMMAATAEEVRGDSRCRQQGPPPAAAISWVFAWTQTRLVLPAWLGVGRGLQDACDKGHTDELRAMYKEWPFFQSTVDLIEMVWPRRTRPWRSTTTTLRKLIESRLTYLNPMNMLQVEVLRHHDNRKLRDALLITINGIAAGIRNTG
uniref:Phosphoenolpyruvate carboxylase n=1 Tax=Oryza glumipatula TaxID=40148 RepID=A0A0D9YEV8_9ORYZ